MKLKHIVLASLIAVIGFFAYCGYSLHQMFRPYGDRGDAYEKQEISNGTFKIRITAHYETGVYLGGAYYVFHSAPVNSDEWHEFFWKRVDDPNPIPSGMFRFVNDRVGYVYTDGRYAVTLDGSHSWCYTNVTEVLGPGGEHGYWYIKEVQIEPDGNGRMVVYTYRNERDVMLNELHTKDYGGHWSVAQGAAKSNNGMHPTANSAALIRKTYFIVTVRRGG